jgi:flagellum-specific peptidoglycan hydrolase FlgJ
MPSEKQLNWLVATAQAAAQAGHIFPDYAACEAAVESGWGTSQLAVRDHNLFGMKQHTHPEYGTISLPTNEVVHGAVQSITANWVVYPNDTECYKDRMQTFRTLPRYAPVLAARDGEAYVMLVGATGYATDPMRAMKVLAVYHEWKGANAPKLSEEIPRIDT